MKLFLKMFRMRKLILNCLRYSFSEVEDYRFLTYVEKKFITIKDFKEIKELIS